MLPVALRLGQGVVMSRYPFMAAVNKFMNSYFGVYSEGTYKELQRRYPKIAKQLIALEEKGKIASTDPRKLTPEDIKEYVLSQRAKGLKDGSINHDLGSLKNLCLYVSGNNCVETARKQYPYMFVQKRRVRLPVTEKPEYNKLVKFANGLYPGGDPRVIRATAESMLAYCAGLRTQELQHSKVRNLDKDFRYIFLEHVKGMGTYGTARTVPIRPEIKHIMTVYLSIRDSDSEFIFPNKDGTYLSTNALGVDRRIVEEEIGVRYDYRKARRTYAQYLIDEGFLVDEVAIILGHTSSRTTEAAYARPRDDRVVRKVIDAWENDLQKDK